MLVMVGMGDVWVRGWRWGVVVIRAGVRVGIMACSGVGFWLELGFDEKVGIDKWRGMFGEVRGIGASGVGWYV